MACGMTKFMEQGGVVGVGRPEPLELGNLHMVVAWAIPGRVATFTNRRRAWHMLDQELGSFDPFVLLVLSIFVKLWEGQSCTLLGVEHLEVAKERNLSSDARLLLLGWHVRLPTLPKDHGCCLLTGFHGSTEFVGLLQREPAVIGVRVDREEKRVHPSVRPVRGRICRDRLELMPRLLPGHNTSLKGMDDRLGDVLVDGGAQLSTSGCFKFMVILGDQLA